MVILICLGSKCVIQNIFKLHKEEHKLSLFHWFRNKKTHPNPKTYKDLRILVFKTEIYLINNYCFPFSNCKDCNLYMFCVFPWLFFGTSNEHGKCSWSLFQPSVFITMCTSGRGQGCFSVMQHDHGGDYIISSPLLHFCCICLSV